MPELLCARGIDVTHEAIGQWCRKFEQDDANERKRRRPRPGDKWHLDEVFLTINGQRYYLWRAVDQDDNVLDILVQSRRNEKAAKKFFRKLLKGLQYVPRVIITYKPKSYGAAKRELLPGVEHRQSRSLNNRCENSHRPTRQRRKGTPHALFAPRRRRSAGDPGRRAACRAAPPCLPLGYPPTTDNARNTGRGGQRWGLEDIACLIFSSHHRSP